MNTGWRYAWYTLIVILFLLAMLLLLTGWDS